MPTLASKESCTACGACINKCHKKCISLKNDNLANPYPYIDENTCVNCKQCEKVCPQLDLKESLNMPIKAYAAWNNNDLIRKTGASGGLASALYEYALNEEIECYGVVCDDKWNIGYVRITGDETLNEVRNSKYSFSNTGKVFCEIESILKSGKSVLWIGLPCQTDGLKKYLGKEYCNLFAVDLVCHGVCSNEYLKQYIACLEERNNKHYNKCYFRDAKFNTSEYAYTLYADNEETPDYVEYISNGLYSMGYHKGITYRENCYHCKYASIQRVGDMTLADYWLIGKKIPFKYDKENVSLIYVNNDRGKTLLNRVFDTGLITMIERPIAEAFEAQGQFKSPTHKSFEQKLFAKSYSKTGDFFKSMSRATRLRRFCQKLHLNRIFDLAYKVDKKLSKLFKSLC